MDAHTQGYLAIEKEMQKRREQADSVRGKDKPFRVEFRYKGGSKHWQYFANYTDCLNAEDSKCSYSIYGHARIEHPYFSEIQVRGKRGGYSKYKQEAAHE